MALHGVGRSSGGRRKGSNPFPMKGRHVSGSPRTAKVKAAARVNGRKAGSSRRGMKFPVNPMRRM